MAYVAFIICPLIVCGIFGHFLLLESILGALTLPVLHSFRQCLNMKGPANTLSIRNSVETLAGFDSEKWQIARKHQLDGHTRFIDVMLEPSSSRLTTFVDGRHALHVRYK